MTSKRAEAEKVEAYTRVLMEAARSEGRANADLVQWQHARKFSPEVLETLAAMQREDDLDLVSQVAKQYKEYLDAEDKTVSVTVTTAVPLDDDLREKVRAKAEADLKAPVYLVERVDPSIIGGIMLEARGKRYDASVRAQLANIRKTLSSSFIVGEEKCQTPSALPRSWIRCVTSCPRSTPPSTTRRPPSSPRSATASRT